LKKDVKDPENKMINLAGVQRGICTIKKGFPCGMFEY